MPTELTTDFRADIEGLRAIAVLSVLLFHAGAPWFRGGYVGVDVFFVVSGYLITKLIIQEIDDTGKFRLRRFYARRARRLLPASAAALIGTGLLTWLFLPASRWQDIAADIVASSLYLMNWRLANRSVDYLAADDALSPLQHFWSLAVEEQFYLFWPLLIVGLASWALGRTSGPRRALTGGILLVTGASLTWSISHTNARPAQAYFATPTRIWELALGALLAFGVPLIRIPSWSAAFGSFMGLVAIVYSSVWYSEATSFPGAAALVPALGAAVLIAVGACSPSPWPSRMISWRPLVIIGGFSYSLYLWHWPLIVLALAFSDPLPLEIGLAVAAFSFIPAALSKKYIEDPIRHRDSFIRPARRAAALGLVCTILGVATGFGLLNAVPAVRATGEPPSALVPTLSNVGPVPSIAQIVPHPVAARDDNPWGADPSRCHQNQVSAELKSCTFGDPYAEISIALVGDSHAAQWLTALEEISTQEGWRLDTYTKSACLFADVTVLDGAGREYSSCVEWNSNLLAAFTGPEAPDLVVTSSSHAYRASEDGADLDRDQSRGAVARGLARTWSRLISAGVPVVVIQDTPRPRIDIPECVLEHYPDLDPCTVSLADAMRGNTPQVAAQAQVTDVPIVNLADRICPQGYCSPVIGNVLVWRDSHHLSTRFVELLTPTLRDRLMAILPAW